MFYGGLLNFQAARGYDIKSQTDEGTSTYIQYNYTRKGSGIVREIE